MKNCLLSFFSIILLVASCQSKQDSNKNLIENVAKSEILVSKHDSILQTMLSEHLQDSIPTLTQNTLSGLSANLSDLHTINSPDNAVNNAKRAAIIYTESLIGIVKAQDIYSNYSDTISDQEAYTLDYLNIEAVKNAQRKQIQYKESVKLLSQN